jgi:hypothetical protein
MPSARAIAPYDVVSPAGIVRSAAQTRRWNVVPSGSTSIASTAWISPRKYASSAVATPAGSREGRASRSSKCARIDDARGGFVAS